MTAVPIAVPDARWLVTGCAGFIGSNLLQTLLEAGQQVVGLDNFSTGHARNLEQVARAVGPSAWKRFRLIEADLCDPAACDAAVREARYVLHQAALGSVPRSIAEPLATHRSNVDGFVTLLDAARRGGVERFVYASSSSVYGDDPGLPKVEGAIGAPLSPYAATKLVDEIYAAVHARTYGLRCVGLRYFNVFGRRQDPGGPYAAVIPKWVSSLLRGEPVLVNGDGLTSRDFCHVANVVQANLLAATVELPAPHEVFNVAVGERTTLLALHEQILAVLRERAVELAPPRLVHRDFRPGDVRHSLADIAKAQRLLGYRPTHRLGDGLRESIDWYLEIGA